MTEHDPVVIVDYARTPCGSYKGVFKDMPAHALASHAIRATLERANIKPEQIDEVILGCVLTAGQGQAPARQASLHAGLQHSTPCTSVNKVCGSGMKALMLAVNQIQSNEANIILAGGMESMTRAPFLLDKTTDLTRLNPDNIKSHLNDHLFLDSLIDAYENNKLMGIFAEQTVEKYGFTREQQDAYAIESLKRAQQAQAEGKFKREITPVNDVIDDEQPQKAKLEKIPELKTVFKENGTITAANASSISDGAATMILMKESYAKALNLKPVARIIAQASHANEPEWFTTAPIGAMQKVLEKARWKKEDIDLFEINEAFACVTMAGMQALELDPKKVNVHGGACALGHPIGASGARIVCTLLNALAQYNYAKGIATLCIGGGEATAMAIERI